MSQHLPPSGHPARFSLGDVVITPGALAAVLVADDRITPYLARHQRGEWGAVDDEDRQANEQALTQGTHLLSAYHLRTGTKIWIIVRHDKRSSIPA